MWWKGLLVGLGVVVALVAAGRMLVEPREIPGRPISDASLARIAASKATHGRYWGHGLPSDVLEWSSAPKSYLQRHGEELDSSHRHGSDTVQTRFDILALSGGGANGAFTAGLLQGWSESGHRFEFDVVTGVSAGAILAPFAFLGTDYDQMTVDFYERTNRDTVFRFDLLGAIFDGWSLAESGPLKAQIDRYVTEKMIEDLVREHERGRLLLVKTVNLDLMQPVVWNLTAIAEDHPDMVGVDLIRRIILASATIPGLFPPVAIPWETDGETYMELHSDGSLAETVFAYPHDIDWKSIDEELGLDLRRRLYVIWNGSPFETRSALLPGIEQIVGRTLGAMVASKTTADIERIYYASGRDGIEFRMIDVPPDVDTARPTDFDPDYIANLIEVGREIGRRGDFWRDHPHRADH